MRGGPIRGGLIRGVTQLSTKRWAYLQRGIYAGGGWGKYRRRNTVFHTIFPPRKILYR